MFCGPIDSNVCGAHQVGVKKQKNEGGDLCHDSQSSPTYTTRLELLLLILALGFGNGRLLA